MGSLHKNIQSMREFLKDAFLFLHFSYYTLMTILMRLSEILLSLQMTLITPVKCDQASDLWQQLGLASELESDLPNTVNWSWKLLSMPGRLNWFRFACLMTLVLWM